MTHRHEPATIVGVVTPGPDHCLHAVLTPLTCGLWFPVWLIVAVCSPRRVVVYQVPDPSRDSAPAAWIGKCKV